MNYNISTDYSSTSYPIVLNSNVGPFYLNDHLSIDEARFLSTEIMNHVYSIERMKADERRENV